ncbi:rhomboid family protein [Tieghemostelium lacteum]|uniref:Rhomboid family protein n=1 Tax=Tieghemostelium lacteum TaxID=361077 RepID=A0A152A4H6_TIELA|nr:rhomboid family protein [Tieghemostelium lacteum]|eukprot:KYR01138.1 rhomboid family protein [Tieghemostelium lacteum]
MNRLKNIINPLKTFNLHFNRNNIKKPILDFILTPNSKCTSTLARTKSFNHRNSNNQNRSSGSGHKEYTKDHQFFKSAKQSFMNPVYAITGANILVYIYMHYDNSYKHQKKVFNDFALSDLEKHPLTLITHMFAHSNLGHLVFNTISLLAVGPQLLLHIGVREFCLLYFAAGIGGGLGFLISRDFYRGNKNSLMRRSVDVAVGASGAITGVLVSYAMMFPYSQFYLYGLLPVPAALLVGGYMAWDAYNEYNQSRSGVAYAGHLAGGLVGALFYLFRFRGRY